MALPKGFPLVRCAMAEGHTYGTIGRLIAAIQAGIAGIILTQAKRLFYGVGNALAR